MEQFPDRKKLIELAHYKMPYGRYKGRYLHELPEAYLIWFQRNGFPEGKLGCAPNFLGNFRKLQGNVQEVSMMFPGSFQEFPG